MPTMTNQDLRARAHDVWRRYRCGGRPNAEERAVLVSAYWASCLPKDPDYSVAQWVEDNFPSLP